jgi:hypothetical protein
VRWVGRLREAAESGGDVVHSLEAAPEGLGSRLAVGPNSSIRFRAAIAVP